MRKLLVLTLLLAACSDKKEEAVRKSMEKSLAELQKPGARVVYPILKAYDWPAKEHVVYKHFLDKDKPPIPLIGYGYNTKDNYVFVTKEELGTRTLDELHKEAMANLRAVKLEWERVDDNTLTASGHDFSAEKTLCPEFILAAEKALKSDRVLIATPRRRVVYAFSGTAPKDKRELFYRVVGFTLNDDRFGNAPITNLVFEYNGTEVVGAATVSGGPGPDAR